MITTMLSALNANKLLKVKGIFHDFNPNANKLPFIEYSVLSDVPAIHGDDKEIQSRVTVRLHIVTKDGAYNEIYKKLNKTMTDLGFMRVQAAEITDNGLKIKAIDYRIGVDV